MRVGVLFLPSLVLLSEIPRCTGDLDRGEFPLVCVKVGHGDMPYLFENLPAHYSLPAMLSAALAL